VFQPSFEPGTYLMYIRAANSVANYCYVIPKKQDFSEVPLTYNIHRKVATDIIHLMLLICRH